MVPGLCFGLGYVFAIRRTAVSHDPTDSVVTAQEPKSELSSEAAAGKRKRKRRRPPGGLGRGLARILTDSRTAPGDVEPVHSGLLQLVGGENCAHSERIRQVVVEEALAAIVDGFDLRGLAILAVQPRDPLRTGASGQAAGSDPDPDGGTGGTDQDRRFRLQAARLPDGWTSTSPEMGEVYQHLERLNVDEQAEDTGRRVDDVAGHQVQVGRFRVLLAPVGGIEDPFVSVAVRSARFSSPEVETLSTVVGSIVAASSESDTAEESRQLIRASTSATLKSEGGDVLAEVRADWPQQIDLPGGRGGRRTGVGRGADPATAVARAAAKACRPRCEVAFAGTSERDGLDVTIAMIVHPERGLRLGFAVREPGDHSGAAEAVFTAAG
jgi:hypothetical protein